MQEFRELWVKVERNGRTSSDPSRRVRAHPGRERAFDSSLSAPALLRRWDRGDQRGRSVSVRLHGGAVGGVQGEHKSQRQSLGEGASALADVLLHGLRGDARSAGGGFVSPPTPPLRRGWGGGHQ